MTEKKWIFLAASAVLAGIFATAVSQPATLADAQEKVPPPSREAIQYSYAPIVRKVAPAVVNVYVRTHVQTYASPFGNDPWFRRFFGGQFGQPTERVMNSLGSGVIINPEGLIVTNYHVVKGRGETEIRVALSNRREYDAKVISKDEKADIAVLKIDGGDGHFP
jgi:S1-C subfamily serine protease